MPDRASLRVILEIDRRPLPHRSRYDLAVLAKRSKWEIGVEKLRGGVSGGARVNDANRAPLVRVLLD